MDSTALNKSMPRREKRRERKSYAVADSVREYVFYVIFSFQKNVTFYVFFLKRRVKKSLAKVTRVSPKKRPPGFIINISKRLAFETKNLAGL